MFKFMETWLCSFYVSVSTYSFPFPSTLKLLWSTYFVSTMDHMTVYEKVVACGDKDKRELSLFSIVSLSHKELTACYSSLFWFYGLKLFSFGSFSLPSSLLFADIKGRCTLAQCQTADKQSQQPASEHSGAFSSLNRIFSSRIGREQKKSKLDLHFPANTKHNTK